mmetsp:Transcript_18509/g.50988  ORF Transcript_18509/g.50988 Transcript_18509/m.50988 type:complete len:269 (-) Transcript_18509:35-841(-)
MPLQEVEHSVQSPQSVSEQLTGASHGTCTLQKRTSELMPTGSRPHSLAVRRTLRCRVEVPPPHVAEQLVHPSQSLNLPSMHFSTLQGSVLQGSTCSLSEALQGFPPLRGMRPTLRWRFRWPPPHEQEQPPQALQSPQAQSMPQEGVSGQSRVSESDMSQPAPPGLRRFTTKRERVCMPTPQLAEHSLQSLQLPTRQSLLSQGCVLQPLVWTSSRGQVSPPCSGKRWTCRCLCVCPPPQVLSHSSQWVHSETTQSTAWRWQVSVSCKAP